MNRGYLFLRTLSDLDSRSRSNDPYEVMGIAGLIRKLFLEKHCLVDSVNQDLHVKLKFVTCESGAPQPASFPPGSNSFWSLQDGLDPENSPPGFEVLTLSRKEFFQQIVIVTADHAYSIKEVVRYVAHVVGGIHIGSPESDKEKALQKIDATFQLGGGPMAIRQLLPVARVLIRGLSPLKEAIEVEK
jgi:hypothetical protein